jgi:chemotaxis protein MotB
MSYADMITILMAFFVVMYSAAGKTDDVKLKAVMHSLRVWLGDLDNGWPAGAGRGPGAAKGPNDGRKAKPPERPRLASMDGRDGLTRGGTVFFRTIAGELTPTDERDLVSISEMFAGKPNLVEVRGQASPRPLPPGGPYKDHSELVFNKCRLVSEFLLKEGIEPERLQVRIVQAAPPSAEDETMLTNWVRVDVLLVNQFVAPRRPGKAQPEELEDSTLAR